MTPELLRALAKLTDLHLFTEANVPLTKALELQLAARYDHYSDAGNTFNPKIGFRYQPIKRLLLRGSANTGFRAPTLYELNGPVVDPASTPNVVSSQSEVDDLLASLGF